jgi:hypothetical protein
MAINIPIITEFADQGLKSAQGAFQNFRTEVANAEGAMGKFKAGTGAAFDAVKANAGAFAIAGGAAFAAFGAKAISAASDFEESAAKIGEIFGDAADSVFDFADDAAQALGQSRQSVLDAAGTFGTFGKAAGLAGEDLSTFSNDFTALASDLASFNNTSPEEAVQALGAALRGESEPLRRYGILLDDASMRQKALELGIISTTKNALTPQQKILAAQALIFEQSSDAQGDFERTSGSLANQQRILQAELENVTIEIGQKLLPVAVKFATFANDKLVPAIKLAADAFGLMFQTIEVDGVSHSGPLPALIDMLDGDLDQALKRVTASTYDGTLAWKDGYRQMIIAANGMKELEEATTDLSIEWERFLGVLTADDAWNSLLDKFDRTKEAAYDALVDGSAASARRAQQAQNDLNREIAKYIDEIGKIPDEVQTRIIGLLERGAFDEALGILNQLRAGVNVPITGTVSGLPVPAGQTPSETTGRGTAIPAGLPSYLTNISTARIPAIGEYSAGVTVNVAGSVISENDLVETVRKGLVNSQRNGAGLVYSNR